MTYFTIQPLETSLFLFSVLFLPCECKHEASEEREPATTGAYQEPAEGRYFSCAFSVRRFSRSLLVGGGGGGGGGPPPPPQKKKKKKNQPYSAGNCKCLSSVTGAF